MDREEEKESKYKCLGYSLGTTGDADVRVLDIKCCERLCQAQ